MAHARLAPSNAHRWIPCPGCIGMCEGLEKWTSEYATLGTAAHSVLDTCVLLEQDPRAYLGHTITVPTAQGEDHVHEVTEDMTDAIGHAIDFIKGYTRRFASAKLYTDLRVNPGKVMRRDDCWGTLDIALDNRPWELVLCDYKHGANLYVEVMDNEQLLTYAVGFVCDHYGPFCLLFPEGPVPHVRLVIVQPRNHGGTGPVREHVVPWQQVQEFATTLAASAHETDKPDARLQAGDHCKWCPARGRCPEFARYALEAAQGEFDVAVNNRLVRHDSPEFADMLRKAPLAVAWATAVAAEGERYALEGGRIRGFKLVRGRSRRYWRDEQSARQALVAGGFGEDQVAPRKLVSPKGAEDLYKAAKRAKEFKETIAPQTGKAPGDLTLVPDTDPRPDAGPHTQFDVESGDLLT